MTYLHQEPNGQWAQILTAAAPDSAEAVVVRAAEAFELDAADGVLPAGATFSRTSIATYIDYTGYLAEAAAGVPRFTYDPTLTYNLSANPWLDTPNFAVDAASPFANWIYNNFAGWTRQVLAVGVQDGIAYADIRFQAAASPAQCALDVCTAVGASSPTVAPSQTVCGEIGVQVVAGSADAGAGVRLNIQSRSAAGGFVANNLSGYQAVGVTMTRIRYSVGVSASAARFTMQLYLDSRGDGRPVDMTLRIQFPVVNLGATYLTDIVPLATLAARVGTTPQYGLLGLMHEEATTNALANPRGEGAVAGTPGTVPTSWGFITTTGTGLTRTIAAGVENGIAYTDFRYAGTAGAANLVILGLNAAATLPCVAGETASASAYVSVFGPNLPTTTVIRVTERNASVFTATDITIPQTATAQPLVPNRRTVTRLFTDGSTTDALGIIICANTNGQVLDFTIRVGFPQLEKPVTLTPTSVMLPPVSTPGASTRNRESLQLPTAGLNFPAGALAVRFQLLRWGSAAVGGANNWLFAAGESAERVSANMASDVPGLTVVSGGVSVMSRNRPGGTAPRDTWMNGAMTWGGGTGAISWDAEAPVADASCASPAPGAPACYVGANWADAGNQSAPIIIRYLRFWNYKLTDAQLQAQSARAA